MAGASSGSDFIRIVGGRVLSNTVIRTPILRIESFCRAVPKYLEWHFKQPELALFFYRQGARKLQGKMDGKSVDREFLGNLAVYPRGLEIEGQIKITSPTSDYTVVFFDSEFVATRLPWFSPVPWLGFENPVIGFGLDQLCAQQHHGDDVFAMMAEGWAMQTLASLARMDSDSLSARICSRLTQANLRRIVHFMEDNLERPIALTDLASLIGLSTRHFIRAFAGTTGSTPHQYLVARRIERAKDLLACGRYSLTEIALATGFSHSQHFATTFKRRTGLSPSRFRAGLQ
jgi:AraC family transcriptional regulator